MNAKLIVAILLIVAAPAAQAQNPKVSKADAEKVVTIIRSDKAKTQTYCEIGKLSKQIEQAKDIQSNGVLKFVIGFASRISKTENNARVPSARRPLNALIEDCIRADG